MSELQQKLLKTTRHDLMHKLRGTNLQVSSPDGHVNIEIVSLQMALQRLLSELMMLKAANILLSDICGLNLKSNPKMV
jgi:hypothetical protein